MSINGSVKKHCALYLPSLVVGGAERMMLNIASGLADRGYEVDLVLVDAHGDFLSDVPPDVDIVDLSSDRVLSSLSGLVRYLRNSEPDVLLSTITPTNVVAVWATLAPGVDVRHVIRVARPESEAAQIQDNTFKQRATAQLARRCYPLADDVIAISEGVAADLREHSNLSSVQVVYNPVVTTKLKQQARERVDHEWFTGSTPVVLGVGRLVDQKDFTTLVRAFGHLVDEREARLVIFGDGPKRDELEDLAVELGVENVIDLPGFTDNPYKYMAQADVFVNSAKHEGFGNVIVEAMAVGAPVVVTDCPGAPAEILRDGELGPLVRVGDPEHMAEGIETALREPIDSDDLIDRADDFSLEVSVTNYESALFKKQ